jgi:hypothetical protein
MDADRMIAGMKDGARLETRFGDVTIEVRTIGELCVQTGSVVACDPAYLWNRPVPFTQAIPLGRHPVSVSIAHLPDGDRRIALAILWVKLASPTRFEMATRGREDVRSLKEGEFFGHGVDSGTSSFMDLATANALYRRLDRNDYDLFMDYMCSKKGRDSPDLRGWADVDVKARLFERPSSGGGRGRLRTWSEIDLDAKSDLHLVAFSSGFGDGFYASYWGYGRDDEIACLITDFRLLDKPMAERPNRARGAPWSSDGDLSAGAPF